MQRRRTSGGGYLLEVSASGGQGIIEYVLIIVVIGLVIVFAGPGVAGAIRNQFNLVGNTVNNGTVGGVEGGASGGGSAGTDSATVQAAIAKDAKDWTLEEQKAVAEDIAAKGEASSAFAKAEAAMNAGTKFSMKLTDGQTLEYKIIGINHDDLADGSGKAGLTFLATSTGIKSRVNATDTNAGGWEKSKLRAKMNSGEIWNLMPSDFQSKVRAVRKLTNNVDGKTKDAAVAVTTDKLFLLSYSEIVDAPYSRWAQTYPWISSEGTQYVAFKGKDSPKENGVTEISGLANGNMFYERGTYPSTTEGFLFVTKYGSTGTGGYYVARIDMNICPVFCF